MARTSTTFQKGDGRRKGRKPGSKNKETIAREDARKRAIEADATPLDVLTAGMRYHYQKWCEAESDARDEADLSAAAEYAAKAAPYVHPRLQSMDASVNHGLTDPFMEMLKQLDGRTQSLAADAEPGMAAQQPLHHNGQGRA